MHGQQEAFIGSTKKTDVRPMMGASIQMLIAGILQTALGLILGEQNDFHLTQNGVFALGYLIVFGSILGYASYIYSITKLAAFAGFNLCLYKSYYCYSARLVLPG